MITEMQARLIATALHEIRPRWAIQSMLTMLEKNAQHPAPFGDTIAAAVNAARDQAVQTPGLIFIDPRFWPEEIKAKLPRPPECEVHDGETAHNCRCCIADMKLGQRPATHIGRHYTQPTIEAPANARASVIPKEIQ